MMMERYSDAIRLFAHMLVYITRTRQYHLRSYQYDQIMKKSEQMYAMLAICTCLCPQRVDEHVHVNLREKFGEHVNRMQKGG
jgi:translation initiation factor 3 subunit L